MRVQPCGYYSLIWYVSIKWVVNCSFKACETLSCQNTAYFTGNNLLLTPFSIHTDSGSNKPPIIAFQLRKPTEGMPVEVRVRLEWNCLQSSVNLYSLSSGWTHQLPNNGQEVGSLTYIHLRAHTYTQAHVYVINSLCVRKCMLLQVMTSKLIPCQNRRLSHWTTILWHQYI